MGNETVNLNAVDDDVFDLDYNRVKIRTYYVKPSLIFRGDLGSVVKLGLSFEGNEVDRTVGRFIALLDENDSLFGVQNFYGAEAEYQFSNKDNVAFPTKGFQFALQTGYKNNVDTGDGFGYLHQEMGFDYKLVSSGDLVLATNFIGQLTFGNNYEFYQGASLGGDNGLRGFRNERFTGKHAFAQTTDVRWKMASVKTSFAPISYGAFVGFDYGRIWLQDETSNKWHNAYGAGFFANIANMLSANISAFNSTEDLRIQFGVGFGF